MALLSDRAIVLRRLDYSETSQILALFTREHGQVRVIAKGIKRSTRSRFAVGIDLLELGQVVWSARADRPQNLGILTEWKQVDAFVGLRDRLERLYAAQYAAEITAELTVDQDPHPTLFNGLRLLLGKLSVVSCQLSASSSQSRLRRISARRGGLRPQSFRTLADLCEFQKSLLIEIGLMPQCENCVGCRSAIPHQSWPEARIVGGDPTGPRLVRDGTEGVYFTSHEGGLLCRNCEANYVEKRSVSPDVIRVLSGSPVDQHSALSTQPSVFEPVAGELFSLLNYHISHLMHKEPRLAKFVRAD